MEMILEALAAFNKWWFDVFVVNAGYWFLVSMGILLTSLLFRIKVRVKTKTREQIFKEEVNKKLREWKQQQDEDLSGSIDR
jgi:hypothetical protein